VPWRTPPALIQGGMGVGVSSVMLARAVAQLGQLGVVSGTALDSMLVRRLQNGDADGAIRRVAESFPDTAVVERVFERYFRPEGRDATRPYRRVPMHTHRQGTAQQDLCVLAAFVEVMQAREGHGGLVGINLLTKVALPTVPTLFGAMLAGVDVVFMGAGIPRDIPGILDDLAARRPVETTLEVTGRPRDLPRVRVRFDPSRFGVTADMHRPAFLPIVSSHVLAEALVRKGTGSIEGFVVEGPTAGGHNAPPRGTPQYDGRGQPVYGPRDRADLDALRALGLPFWIAGGITSPSRVAEARNAGAAGVQIGTLFAFCRESGMEPSLRHRVLDLARRREAEVLTDARASSTGFPFKVVQVRGTVSDPAVYGARERVCDMGYLREAYATPAGGIGYRCAAEPVEQYIAKGGRAEDTEGRRCLCNGLAATIGLGQVQKTGASEPPLVTSGDALRAVHEVLGGRDDYDAADVVRYLLGQ
jgi:NAD(P)H-dependent flavin oxidoreductase YrpB (nitropropane dioxygenase family)